MWHVGAEMGGWGTKTRCQVILFLTPMRVKKEDRRDPLSRGSGLL